MKIKLKFIFIISSLNVYVVYFYWHQLRNVCNDFVNSLSIHTSACCRPHNITSIVNFTFFTRLYTFFVSHFIKQLICILCFYLFCIAFHHESQFIYCFVLHRDSLLFWTVYRFSPGAFYGESYHMQSCFRTSLSYQL